MSLFNPAKPQHRDLLFYVLLLIGLIVCGWDNILFKQPSELHLWRQSDCISLADHYAKGNGFFEPEIHCRISDDGLSGKTAAEFPIIYYIVGKIWSFTGRELWIFRLFNALTCIIALSFLYKTLLRITNSWFWSAIAPFILLASPLYAYYGISFLTNIPALNCILIGWCIFYNYYETGKIRSLIWVAALFSMAGLLKASALTSYVLLLMLFAADFLRIIKFKKDRTSVFQKKWIAAAILTLPVIVNLAWYLGFVEPYCTKHEGRYSFTSPVPVWTYSPEQRDHIWTVFKELTAHLIYPGYIWLFFGIIMLFLFVRFRKTHPFWLISMPAIFIGHSMFSLLFFFCLDIHDYYHADILVYFVFVYCALACYLVKHETEAQKSVFVRFIAVLAVTYAVMGSSSNVYLRYNGCPASETAYRELFSNKRTIDLKNYLAYETRRKQSYIKVGEKLTQLGFTNETPVISLNDFSFNITLIMIDRPGFTNIDNQFSDSTTTAYRIQRGAQVMLIEDPDTEQRGARVFMGHKLFQIDHIAAYDLRPYSAALSAGKQ